MLDLVSHTFPNRGILIHHMFHHRTLYLRCDRPMSAIISAPRSSHLLCCHLDTKVLLSPTPMALVEGNLWATSSPCFILPHLKQACMSFSYWNSIHIFLPCTVRKMASRLWLCNVNHHFDSQKSSPLNVFLVYIHYNNLINIDPILDPISLFMQINGI